MRTLTLIRHAKSSWDYPELSDFERPLNDRGRRDAPAMARRLLRLPPKPDLLLSSPALRALTTARLFAEVLRFSAEAVAVNARIYEASAEKLLGVAQRLDDAARHVMLFGHNPGISEFAHLLAHCPFDDMPTCAAARFEFEIKAWGDLSASAGKLVHYSFPKDGNS
jgi:phosphohistidine phosphatase